MGGIADLGPEVAAMGIDQLFSGDVAQPEEKWQRLVHQVPRQAFRRLQERLLEDVGVVEPALELAVQAEPDHALEPLAVARKEFRHGRRVASGRSIEQVGKVLSIAHRRNPPH